MNRVNEDVEKTASDTQFGDLKRVVMPSILWNTRSTFQRAVNDALGDHLANFVWVYIDNILIFSKNVEENCQRLDLVHKLLQVGK